MRWLAGTLHPDIVLCCKRAASLAGVYDTSRLDEQCVTFTRGTSDMFNAFWHDEHFSGADSDSSVPKTNLHFTAQYQKDFVRVFVIVPDELSL